jgi:hypothetical protein
MTTSDVPAGKPPTVPVEAVEAPVRQPEKPQDAPAVPGPPPIPTGFPEPATGAPVTAGGVTVTETGTVIYPQPMKPAREGHVNLATVPPMGKLTVPPLEDGGEAVVIDVYGTEVDQATAERAYAAAQTAGFNLREL